MKKLYLGILSAALFTSCAMADTIDVPYSADGFTLNFLFPDGGGNTFAVSGPGGTLALNDSAVTRATIRTGAFSTIPTGGSGSELFNLLWNLRLGEASHTISQSADWRINPTGSTFTAAPSDSVNFETSSGIWNVRVDAFSLSSGAAAGSTPIAVEADFTHVPEPGTWGLAAISLMGIALLRRKRVA